nr:HAMP domain-containing sensor histidine kinase [Kofleriaceae bacterium]
MRPRRAWIYILSVAALLVPAGGIAYLGASSYRDERGAVDAQLERQRDAAMDIAGRVHAAIDGALDAVANSGPPGSASGSDAPGPALARYAFELDKDGKIVRPRALAIARARKASDRLPCESIEDCAALLRERKSRVTKLRDAQRAEAAHETAPALRAYESLAKADDVGPDALLGIARIVASEAGRGTISGPAAARGAAALDELDRRFASRDLGDLPVPLVTSALRATTAQAKLALAETVLAGRYDLDTAVELGVATRLRREGQDAPARALATLDAHLDERRAEARAAAGLQPDLGDVARDAGPQWHGRVASREPARTLIYRRTADGGVVGISVDAAMLEAAAGAAPTDVAPRARTLIVPSGATAPAGSRVIAQVPLGEALPHLALAIATPASDPDPLDEVIRARSRRHVAYTSGLAIALAIGLLATIRGAARARELARLKSDFVSTVSHELKTPLTSIRMFAEMLEQGVAQGDAAKMRRYHHVIVQESQRLGLLIANLLDYAQIERGTRRYSPTRQAADELARHAVTTYEALHGADQAPDRAAARNPIAVEVSPDAVRAELEVDRDVVVQAILNLITNAAKYGGADKPIEVLVGADELAVAIAVRDHGPGIPVAEQQRIFREFYRAPEAYRSGVEGTGLGLALVKRHVEALGGTVDLVSAPGAGATFTIRLPRVVAAVEEHA